MDSVRLQVTSARRKPDPVFRGAEEHHFTVPVLQFPQGVLETRLDQSNPREQNLDLAVYKDAEATLMNRNGTTPNAFHVKSRGILITADALSAVKGDENLYDLALTDVVHGIGDGGHLARLIWEHKAELAEAKITQFVNVQVLSGYPPSLLPEIIEARNSGIQVQTFTMLNFGGAFDWIKEAEAASGATVGAIAYRQNEKGAWDVREVLMLLDALNVDLWPNGSPNYPVRAYSSKQSVVNAFKSKPESFTWMKPIVIDAIRLFETISHEGGQRLLDVQPRSKLAGRFTNRRTRGIYEFPFIGQTSQDIVLRGVSMPVLGAFRHYVERGRDGRARWKGGFGSVLNKWQEYGGHLMLVAATELGADKEINPLGKERSFWAELYLTLKSLDPDLR